MDYKDHIKLRSHLNGSPKKNPKAPASRERGGDMYAHDAKQGPKGQRQAVATGITILQRTKRRTLQLVDLRPADPTQAILQARSEIIRGRESAVIQRLYEGLDDAKKLISLVENYSHNKELKEAVEKDEEGRYQIKINSLKGYGALNDEKRKQVFEQVWMKILHNNLVRQDPEEQYDIKQKFDNNISCVITALLYAEGGTVMGVSTVKGLHHILFKLFPKWRQYSDDKVLDQMYKTFGYSRMDFDSKSREEAVKDADKTQGMTSMDGEGQEAGHMVGFKKTEDGYKFKDNEAIESSSKEHARKDDQVNRLWWK